MRIPFVKTDIKCAGEQVTLFRALQTDSKAKADFFEKQESKVIAAINCHFAMEKESSTLELLSYRDIFHESIIRFYDAIQQHRLYESEGRLFCRDRSGSVSEFKGTLGNYLQCIAKNVFLENRREQIKYPGVSVDVIVDNAIEHSLISDDFTQERHWRIDAVQAVINNMQGVCRTLLKEYLMKDTSKKTDADIAKQLHYKNVNSVKTQRNRCMSVFKSAITKKIASYGG